MPLKLILRRISRVVRPQGRVFFGWWIVLSSMGIQFMSGLMWMHSYGAYVVLLQEEFGWSSVMVAGAFTLTRIESGLLGPLQGWLTDRYGPRLILLIGNIIFGLGFMGLAFINNLLTFYLAVIVIAVGGSLGGFATLMVSIVHWFDRHRSKAIATSQLGFSLGGLAVPLLIFSLELFGWRNTAFFSGLLIMFITLPCSLMIRHNPENYGFTIDGTRKVDMESRRRSFIPRMPSFTAREALRTSAFWFLSIGHSLALLTVSTVMVHLIPHLTRNIDFTLAQAGFIVALMTACQMTGQVIGGYLGDRVEKRLLCCLCLALHATGMLVVAFATNTWMVVLFAITHGFGWGIRAPLIVAIRADYFGPSSFGTILGFSSLIMMFGMALGPVITGFIYDVYDSYQLGFGVMGLMATLGAMFFFLAKKPDAPRPEKPVLKQTVKMEEDSICAS